MEIFRESRTFPKDEKFSLTDQIRRSSRSVATNIAEAYRKRQYPNMFVNKLSDGDMELAETQTWLDFSLDCEYLPRERHVQFIAKYEEVGKMLGAMCGVQVGGAYALFGSYGGRCVNFNSAKVTLTVVDLKSKKTLLTVTTSTDASLEDEIAGGRFLKGLDAAGEFERTPEGRIVAGLMKKGLDSLVGEMSKTGLATVDIKPGTTKTAVTSERTTPPDPAFETFVSSQPAPTGYVPSKAEKDAARKKKYGNSYAPR